MAMTKSPVSIYIGFGGAGTLGPAEVGALKALLHLLPILMEREILVKGVTGVSAGSIIAALLALGYTPDEMIEILVDANFADLIDYSLFNPIFEQTLASNKNVLAWLSKLTKDQVMKDVSIPLTTVTSDIVTGKAHTWTSTGYPEMYVKDAVYSSMAIPFIFPEYLGRYVDGGTTRNIPVQYVPPKNSIVLSVDDGIKERQINGFYERVERLLSMLLSDDDELLDTIGKMTNVPIIKIPTGSAGFLERNMTKDEKMELVMLGHNAMNDFLISPGGTKWMKSLSIRQKA